MQTRISVQGYREQGFRVPVQPIQIPPLGKVCMEPRVRYGGGSVWDRLHLGKQLTNRRIAQVYGLVSTERRKKTSEEKVKAMVKALLRL